ncbi:MAG: hypothetical protein R2824_33245 [Saprospiraceae bacterium]|nr:hypothetical protein [Lewinella sp.]
MRNINLKAIFDSGQIVPFLTGSDGLSLENIYSDMPTDPNLVAQHIICFINENSIFCNKWKDVEKGLLKLAECPEGTWLLSYYLLSFTEYSKKNVHYFDGLDLVDLSTQLESSVKKFESSLRLDKRWTGANYENGLYGDVARLIRIINQDYGLDIVI